MVSVTALLLPILISAVAAFVVSSVIHMAVQYHKNDYRKLPNEDAVLNALREQQIPPGEYMFPRADSMQHMKSPEMVARYERGPVGVMVLMTSGHCSLGKPLAFWFVYCVAISLLTAYVTGLALPQGAAAMQVFRIASAAAFIGHGMSGIQNSIWKGVPWSTAWKYVFDGLLYALATGAVFAWLWP